MPEQAFLACRLGQCFYDCVVKVAPGDPHRCTVLRFAETLCSAAGGTSGCERITVAAAERDARTSVSRLPARSVLLRLRRKGRPRRPAPVEQSYGSQELCFRLCLAPRFSRLKFRCSVQRPITPNPQKIHVKYINFTRNAKNGCNPSELIR